MEIVGGQIGFPDSDILRENRVQAPNQSVRGYGWIQSEMRHLAMGVNPRVGSPRSDDAYRVAGYTFQALLETALNRVRVRLHLPAPVVGAVVGEGNAVMRHELLSHLL